MSIILCVKNWRYGVRAYEDTEMRESHSQWGRVDSPVYKSTSFLYPLTTTETQWKKASKNASYNEVSPGFYNTQSSTKRHIANESKDDEFPQLLTS